jgi:hypothetical protein
MEIQELSIERQKRELRIIFKDPDTYEKSIAAFSKAYEEIEQGPLDEGATADLVENGTANIVGKYRSEAEQQISASGIRSASMKAMLLKATEETLDKFNEAYIRFVQAAIRHKAEVQKAKVLRTSLIMKGCGLQKSYGHSKDPKDPFKYLEIGNKSWIATECGMSWGLKWTGGIKIMPGHDEYYYYAKCPQSQSEEAALELHHQPMPNTPTHYMILMKSGSYEEIDFN